MNVLDAGKKQAALGRKILLAIIVINFFILGFAIKYIYSYKRMEFLKESEILLKYLNYEWLADLSVKGDYSKDEKYIHLEQQLADLVKHNPLYEILYFAAQDLQGKPFMYISSIPRNGVSFRDEEHDSDNIIKNDVFNIKDKYISGFGEAWRNKDISVFVSLKNEKYGNLNFVFGADISIFDCIMSVVTDDAVLVSLAVLIFFISMYFFFPYKVVLSQDTLITYKLAPYILVTIFFVLFVFVFSLMKQQKYFTDKMIDEKIDSIPFHFSFMLKKEEGLMKSILDGMSTFPEVKEVLQDSRRELLKERYKDLYDVLCRDGAISHFSFYSAKGINILRLHSDAFGDFDNKFLIKKAKETKKVVSGVEIEKNGEIVLWVVKPIYTDGYLLGFIEVGNRIESVMRSLDIKLDASITFFVRKTFIDKEVFEKNRGGIVEWEDFENSILIYSSYTNVSFLKDNVKSVVDKATVSAYVVNNSRFEKNFIKGHLLYTNMFPFFDYAGQHVGDILAVYDYTETDIVFSRIIKIGGAFLLILIVFEFLVFYFILRNTDKNILRQRGELVDKESYLSFMVDSLDESVIITDNKGNILMMNAAAGKLAAFDFDSKELVSVEEVFGRWVDNAGNIFENPINTVIDKNKKVASSGAVFVSKNGIEHFVDYIAKPVLSSKGALVGVVLVVNDRTNQYNNLIRGDYVSDKLQLAIGSSGIGVWEYNFDTGAMYWDKNMRSIYGVSEGLMIDASMWIDVFLYSDDRGKVVKLWQDSIKSSLKMDFETRIVLSTGEIKYVRITAIPLGRDSKYVGVTFDITEAKIFQQKIQKSEKAISLLFDNIDSAIFEGELIFDDEGQPLDYIFRKVNSAFEKLTNMSDKNILGRFASQVFPEMQISDFIRSCGEVVSSGKSVRFDKYSEKFDVWLSVHIYKTEGNLFAVLLDNITDRKITEEKLKNIIEQDKKQAEKFHKSQLIALSIMEDANSARKEAETLRIKAEKAYKAKSQFLANMSHEIRTPMNAILGYGDLLRKTYLNEDQAEYLRMICSSGELLVGIIDDILDVSKFEAGRIVLESIEFDINYLCCNVFKLILPQIKDKQIETYIDFAQDVPVYWKGDPTRLRQVLINLLANAVKFTYKGKIGLEVNSKGTDKTGKYNVLEFIVSDTGIGISRSKQKSIFEAFDQANQSITREFGGTGLGLAICKAVVEAMGGEIHVASVKGKGSKFVFTVNLELVDKKDMPQKIEPLNDEDLKDKKVLIVDSIEESRELLDKYCKEKSMKVLGSYEDAKTFKRDLVRFSEEKIFPDILIMDAVLSDDSGLNVLRAVSSDFIFENTKFITVTSDVRAGTAKVSFDAGFHGYLAKPFNEDDFYKVLKFVLGLKSEINEIVTRHVGGEEEEKKTRVVKPVGDIKIILAEDNIVNQKLMREYFKVLGVAFDIVSNGEEAVQKIQTGQYSLCFMDIQMPVMDGLKATSTIRETISKDIPIIGISANVMEEHRKTAMDAGMDDYLKKPVNIGTIRKVLEQWCK